MGDIYAACEQKAGTDTVLTLTCFPALIQQLITVGFGLAGTVALIFIIISGYKLTRSGGDPKQAEDARKTLTYAIIGLVIVLLSAAIINIIATITKAPVNTMGNFK